MLPVTTLTFNPCIDKSTRIPVLEAEKKLRCHTPGFEPGGGGINVARAISKLGGDARAIYPAGGYSGKFLNSLLENEGVSCHYIETSSHTRENLIVVDESTSLQYRFGMPGTCLEEPECRQCVNAFEVQDSDYKVVSGSWPPGLLPDIIKEIAHSTKQKEQRLILDSGGDVLRSALQEGGKRRNRRLWSRLSGESQRE